MRPLRTLPPAVTDQTAVTRLDIRRRQRLGGISTSSLDRPDYETDTAELEIVERVAGRAMRCAARLHIFVRDLESRPVLGRLAQRVAERTEGWVLVEFEAPPAADLLDRPDNAGRYVSVDGYAYLDAPAMATWYAHRSFHVIK